MKFKKIVAAVAAAAVAVSMTAFNAFAALYEDSLAENGGPKNNAYLLAGVEGVDYSKVAKIEAVVTTDSYVNGTIGVSCNKTWTTPNQLEATAETKTWVLDGLKGIDSTDDSGALKQDVVQVQFWWLNAGKFSLDSLKLYDASGNVLQEAGVTVAAAPEETTAAPEETTVAPEETTAAPEETTAAADDEEEVAADDNDDAAVPEETTAAVTEEVVTTAAETAAVADNTTTAAATGNVAVASVAAVMVIAGTVAIASKKRK